MSKFHKDDGITLVELLASIAILSIVIMLAGSVHIFGQRQFIAQTDSASQSNDLSYGMAMLSRDIRNSTAEEVSYEEGVLDLGEITYSHSGTALFRNNQRFLDDIADFEVAIVSKSDEDEKNDRVDITLRSVRKQSARAKEYTSSIYFRR